MDLIVLDTETTGLEVGEGHRVIEVGCVCLRQRKHTDHKFHSYLNPGRGIDPGAQEVHGISSEFLQMCTNKTKIPMTGTIGSLNVSVSAGVVLYEAVRQRQ